MGLLSLKDIESLFILRSRLLACPWVRGAHLYPFFNNGDLRRGELLFRRHLEIRVFVPDGLDKKAHGRLPRHQRGSTLSSLKDTLASVEKELCLGSLPASGMAFVAPFHKQRTHLVFEEFQFLGRKLLFGYARRRNSRQDQ